MLKDVRLFVCIAFHYSDTRLTYLRQVLYTLATFPCYVGVCILTNTADHDELRQVQSTFPPDGRCAPNVLTVSNMAHPYMLPWAHKPVMKQHYEQDPTLTHFAYLEDDLALTSVNLAYWIESREILKSTAFYPSFLRVEQNDETRLWYSTELQEPASLAQLPYVHMYGHDFVNLPEPYQGMSVFDRALFEEHMNSVAFSAVDYANLSRLEAIMRGDPCYFNARERASYGQIYMNVPQGFKSRNLLRVSREFLQPDMRACVHHLPNNYANDKASAFGKVLVTQALRA